MNRTDRSDDRVERLLKKAHLPGPSPQLRGRVTGAARGAWTETSTDVRWQVPLRRLAVSAAAAVLLISLADYFSDHAVARWRSGRVVVTGRPLPDIDALPESPYAPFVNHIATANRRPSGANGAALREYVERLREVLNETQQNGTSKEPASIEGRSRVLPSRPGLGSYA